MRGQAMVDALMLVLMLVVVTATMHVFLGEQAMKAQALRYQSAQHQAALVSVLERQVELTGARGRVADLLAFQACNGCPADPALNYCPGLQRAINDTLYEYNEGQRHYIFSSSTLTAYDNKTKVCLDAVPVARYGVNSSCGQIEVIYGTWYNWYNPPEVC